MESILDLTSGELRHLAFLSSSVHKNGWDERKYKHLGRLYEYLSMSVGTNFRKKELETARHVVEMYADKDKKLLDRVFIVDYHYRNPFSLYNIKEGKLVEVNIFQDDLFNMFAYLIEAGYESLMPVWPKH